MSPHLRSVLVLLYKTDFYYHMLFLLNLYNYRLFVIEDPRLSMPFFTFKIELVNTPMREQLQRDFLWRQVRLAAFLDKEAMSSMI